MMIYLLSFASLILGLCGDARCIWDQDPDFYEGPVTNVDRQETLCASYDAEECIAAADGLMDALCKWTGDSETEVQSLRRLTSRSGSRSRSRSSSSSSRYSLDQDYQNSKRRHSSSLKGAPLSPSGSSSSDGPRHNGETNPMGQCQYDGSLGYNPDSNPFQAECMRLDMAECMTTGPSGRCEYVVDEDSKIGCVWDGTGGENLTPADMESRCAMYTHDQKACEGAPGLEDRCKWSKYGSEHGALHKSEMTLFDKVRFSTDDLSTRDALLLIFLATSLLIGLYQLYRWCVNWKLHREYKLVNTSDPVPRSSHLVIDGKAYF